MEHHPEGIYLEADTYSALVKTIQRDCRVLESFKIMDYSLLVGIHNLDQAAREKIVSFGLKCANNNNFLLNNLLSFYYLLLNIFFVETSFVVKDLLGKIIFAF